MRRTAPALVLAGLLLSTTACGTGRSPGPGAAPTVPSATAGGAAPAQAQARALCETLGQLYGAHLGPFAEALSATVEGGTASGGATARKQAQQQLTGLADGIVEATRANPDAQVRADGEQTAAKLRRTAGDTTFFSGIRSPEDVNKVVGTSMKTWMAPVARHCS